MFDKPTPHSKKIFRGAYTYLKNDQAFAEENFEVYKDNQELGMYFLSKLHSRVSTGELLSVDVTYNISKDYVPNFVMISRSLGKESVKEIYDFNPRKGLLTYLFINDEEEVKHEINTPPKFHITAPTACSSMLFLRSKKFDATSKNYYLFLSSRNQWAFEEMPKTSSISVQRISSTAEKLVIDNQNVQAVEYKLSEDENESDAQAAKAQSAPPSIRIYLSPYVTIPYMLRTPDGAKVQIKFLNNLTEKE